MEHESTLWTGNPSHYANLKSYIGWGLFTALFVAACASFQHKFDHQYASDNGDSGSDTFLLFLVIGLIIPVVMVLWNVWKIRSTQYSLTSQRLIISHGLFKRTIDELELYRVKDYRIEQSFLQRLLKIGTVILETSDHSDPTVTLDTISDPEKVRDIMRERVEERRNGANGRVREVEISH